MVNCVYIHIPFCLKKCNYCAFCSFAELSNIENYIDSLMKEIKFHYKNEKLNTIYFGGGTPSLIKEEYIEEILNCFNFDKNTEITLEANPNSLSLEKLVEYKKIGITRLSIGVQSFNDDLLKIMGRLHDKKDIYKTIENIDKAGFKNYNIDLMYGLPYQKTDDWIKTLDEAVKLNPYHISLYGLKLEKGTNFYKNYKNSNILPSLDIQADMYNIAIEKLKEKYIHYEFSNFAKSKNYISKHNTAYWKRYNYYGFGLSASGFIDNKRYTNTFKFKEYLANPLQKEYEILTKQNEIEEEIFLGLRLAEGIDFKYLNKKYNIDIEQIYGNLFNKYLKSEHLVKTECGIRFSKKGILVSNEILCEFIDI